MIKNVIKSTETTSKTDKERLSKDLISQLPSFSFDDDDHLTDGGIWYITQFCGQSTRDVSKTLGVNASTISRHAKAFADRYDDDSNNDDDVVTMRNELTHRITQAAAQSSNLSNGDANQRIAAQVTMTAAQQLQAAGRMRVRSYAISLQVITYDSYLSLFWDTDPSGAYFAQREGCPDAWYTAFVNCFRGDASNYQRMLRGEYEPRYSALDTLIKYMQDGMDTDDQRATIKIACAVHDHDQKSLHDIVVDDTNPKYKWLYAERDDQGLIHIFHKDKDSDDVEDITDKVYDLHNGTVQGNDTITPLDVLDIDDKNLAITPIDVYYDGSRTQLYRYKMPHIHLTAWAPAGIVLRNWARWMGIFDAHDYHLIDRLQGKGKNTTNGARFSFNAMIGYLAHMTVQARMDGKHQYNDWRTRIRHTDNLNVAAVMNSNLTKFEQELMENVDHVDIPGLVDMCIDGELDATDLYDSTSVLSRRLTDKRGTTSNRMRQEFLNQYNQRKWEEHPCVDKVGYVFGDIGGIGKTVVAREFLDPHHDPEHSHNVIVAQSGNSNSTAGMVERYLCEMAILFDDIRPDMVASGFGGVTNFLTFLDRNNHDVRQLKGRGSDTLVSACRYAFTCVTSPYRFWQYVKNHGHEVGSDTQFFRRLTSLMFVARCADKPEYSKIRHFDMLGSFDADTFGSMYLIDTITGKHVDLVRSHYLFNVFCQYKNFGDWNDMGCGDYIWDELVKMANMPNAHFKLGNDRELYLDDNDCGVWVDRKPLFIDNDKWQPRTPSDPCHDFQWYINNQGANEWYAIDPRARYDHVVRCEAGSYSRWLLHLLTDPQYELHVVIDGVDRRVCIDPNRVRVGDVYTEPLSDRDLAMWGGSREDYTRYTDEYPVAWSSKRHLDFQHEVEKAIPGTDPVRTPLAYVLDCNAYVCDETWIQHCACNNDDYLDRTKKHNVEHL